MTTVTIADSTYQRLKEIATAMRLPLDQFLEEVANHGVRGFDAGRQPIAPGTKQWMAAFNAWVASHGARECVADDSRDAIYGDELD